MQFLANGPDIPETLLQAHEEGRVVFFCGAGISYPAGLPGFGGLVDRIYADLGAVRSDLEDEAYQKEKYDATLDLLEQRYPGSAGAVREALAKSLNPNFRLRGSTATHEALLELGRCRTGALRLVTTNFDRIFERAATRRKHTLTSYCAPMLPIPKSSRWDGVVYLHGQIPQNANAAALRRLVVTSGDFGLAYLIERWASRFVTELFRSFTVCFIGYSINDPVLRYMMDALAADRRLGEFTPEAYAFGECKPGNEAKTDIEWRAKQVRPILYEVPVGTHDHSMLHKSLRLWAETYRDGVLGKERIVANYALARPSASTRQDNFVGRMLWAIAHDSGLPAKLFANFNPVPSLEWLDAFSKPVFTHQDLIRFGVDPRPIVDDKLTFSLVDRPAPYALSPNMRLAAGGSSTSNWDPVMMQIAEWLMRHLNSPKLILWMAKHGGRLHLQVEWLIENQLDRFAKLEKEGKLSELDEIRLQAPDAIPSPDMIKFWRLLLSGRVKATWRNIDVFQWRQRLSRHGLTVTLRFELREILSPKVLLREPFRWEEDDEEGTVAVTAQLRKRIDWELVLAGEHVGSHLRDRTGDSWKKALPALVEDLQQLLLDALDLLKDLGEADAKNDRSVWDLPSISAHWQNRGFRDWTTLIELLRDAWDERRLFNPQQARPIAQAWFDIPYPTFKRLALYAASVDGGIADKRWVDWLTSDGSWWLWATDTMREVLRLLVLRGSDMGKRELGRLELAVLQGPPRDMYVEDITPDRWQDIVTRAVWLRLAKLRHSGATLSPLSQLRFDEISNAHPSWKLAVNERDEFSSWMSGTGDPDFEDQREVEVAPLKLSLLQEWLKKPQSGNRFNHEDNWRHLCRTHFYRSFAALRNLAKEGHWPASRWREALQGWSEEGAISRSIRYAPPLLLEMPADLLNELLGTLSWWVQAASKAKSPHEAELIALVRRIISASKGQLKDEPESVDWQIWEPVMEAINHPVGQAIQALLNIWFAREPNDNDGLPEDLSNLFSLVCDTNIDLYQHGRVVLAANLIALFRVDRSWTILHMLPLFSWTIANRREAKGAWEGFLWSPRLHGPLLTAFKDDFLATASHYADLGNHRRQFAAFLTYAGLTPLEGFTQADFRRAVAHLPQEALGEMAQALSQAQEGSGGQKEDYWRNRLHPFWKEVWPKSADLVSPGISELLARVCIAAGNEFPSAVKAMIHWLSPTDQPHFILHLFSESGLCSIFPDTALLLLGALINAESWPTEDLLKCLEQIGNAKPTLKEHGTYRRLDEHYRRKRG